MKEGDRRERDGYEGERERDMRGEKGKREGHEGEGER